MTLPSAEREWCKAMIRRTLVWQGRQNDSDGEIEAIEQEVRRRLGIHASLRQRTQPTAGQRAATVLNLLGARLNGELDRVDTRLP